MIGQALKGVGANSSDAYRLGAEVHQRLFCGSLDLRAAHLCRMLEPMKTDECTRPVHVGPFGLQAVVNQPATLANLIKQVHRLQRWQSHLRQ